jgi:hypothetical protein
MDEAKFMQSRTASTTSSSQGEDGGWERLPVNTELTVGEEHSKGCFAWEIYIFIPLFGQTFGLEKIIKIKVLFMLKNELLNLKNELNLNELGYL